MSEIKPAQSDHKQAEQTTKEQAPAVFSPALPDPCSNCPDSSCCHHARDDWSDYYWCRAKND